jgi:hypothetical protein
MKQCLIEYLSISFHHSLTQSNMMFGPRLGAGLLLAGLAYAQGHYADNQAALLQDSEAVAANFPDVEGVTLYSPAFLNPESVPAGFQNGTSGPTDEAEMGEYCHLTKI